MAKSTIHKCTVVSRMLIKDMAVQLDQAQVLYTTVHCITFTCTKIVTGKLYSSDQDAYRGHGCPARPGPDSLHYCILYNFYLYKNSHWKNVKI